MPTQTVLIIVVSVLVALGIIVLLVQKSRRSSRELPWEKPEVESRPAIEEDILDVTAVTMPEATAKTDKVKKDASESEVADATNAVTVTSNETSETDSLLEAPESVPSRIQRLRARLSRSGGFGNALLAILSRGDLSTGDWEELEETLLLADVGLDATTELMDKLRTEVKVQGSADPAVVRAILRKELIELVDPRLDRSMNLEPEVADDGQAHPASVLLVGVNGTGKTTTVGKLARLLVAEDKSVLLGAADTFRAAAAEQLQTWGERVGVEVVRSDREGADPASVAFEAVKVGHDKGVDVVIVDTAGRLQNKSGLMDELGKIKRVMERQAPIREVLLVLDATTGQNGMRQAEVFAEVAGITGIVLTKLDGSAKGGIVISVQRALGVPVKFVGLGEGPDDLAPFDVEGFVDSLLS